MSTGTRGAAHVKLTTTQEKVEYCQRGFDMAQLGMERIEAAMGHLAETSDLLVQVSHYSQTPLAARLFRT